MNVLISFEDGTELRQKFVWFDIMLITLMITTIIHSSAERFFFPCPVSRFSIIQNTFHWFFKFSTVEYLFACVDQPQHKWTSSYAGCDGCLTNKSFFFQATNIHVRWFGRKERSGNTYEVVPTKPLRSVTNRSNFSINYLFADGFFCNINILNFCGAEYRWKHVYSELTRYISVRKRHLVSQRREFLENLSIEIIP